jgi:nitroimidazol reductase NimA-like FMN-containing flavoprotein (pyridoxamine 5'-phosphate oxidase superfamily)
LAFAVVDALSPTERSRVRRAPHRAATDPALLHAVLDEALICHVGFVDGDAPVVIPTSYGRDGDVLYLHGSTGSRTMRHLATGAPVCVTVTLLDGLVLARSVMHHSMNYRSAVIFGAARAVTEPAERMHAFEVITEHLVPGRWADARHPNRREAAATAIVALDLTEASVKLRTGGPNDDAQDLDAGTWAGVLPITSHVGAPMADADTPDGVNPPPYATVYRRPATSRVD